MCSFEQFKIDLKALSEDITSLEYELTDDYFSALKDADIQGGSLHVSGSILKAVGFFELLLDISGTVRIPCDRCLEDMEQPIETQLRLVAKLVERDQLGEGSGDTQQDDLILVDEGEGLIDLSWYIYESIALAVPIQHVHQPGDCNDAMMRVLDEHSAARSSDADASEQEIDPRWEKLKDFNI